MKKRRGFSSILIYTSELGGFHLLAHGGGGRQNYMKSLSHITQPPFIAMDTIS